jgi:hypothetical protein
METQTTGEAPHFDLWLGPPPPQVDGRIPTFDPSQLPVNESLYPFTGSFALVAGVKILSVKRLKSYGVLAIAPMASKDREILKTPSAETDP